MIRMRVGIIDEKMFLNKRERSGAHVKSLGLWRKERSSILWDQQGR